VKNKNSIDNSKERGEVHLKTKHALSQNTQLQQFKVDLHIHTVLSPCADLEMSPVNIIRRAKETGLQVIGITDHNSTKNAKLVKRWAEKEGIFVLCGAEVTTKEEVHCLAFFESENELNEFQQYLEKNMTIIPNPDGHFGYQPVVDENDTILEMVDHYLPAALKVGIHDIQQKVYELNGIFIPAHVDRQSNGIYGQLGFIPAKLKFDGLGISKRISEKDVRKHYVIEKEITIIRNSDTHFLAQMGEICTIFYMKEMNFYEVKMALSQQDGRYVENL